MQSASVVDGYISLVLIKISGTKYGTCSRLLAEVPEAFKDWTVVSEIEAVYVVYVLVYVLRSHCSKKFYIVIGMELGEVLLLIHETLRIADDAQMLIKAIRMY